ncbi:endonuclease [Candidatus Woesearchaeota archaeon]|nr:endonuclease [Candidatus Woesearchaeota archaeon]
MNYFEQIYHILINKYGPQFWWPVTSQNKVIPEYKKKDSLTEKQKTEIMFGAILTQNTSWKNTEKAIVNLNKNDLIDIDKILEINVTELANLIKSSGYFNQKAKKLKNICLFLKENPVNELERLKITDLRKKLININGIGKETADSIILYAFNKPIFVIDAYTKRLFSRSGLCRKDVSYDELQELFHSNLEKNAELFNEYHALIVEHCKEFCRKKPLCKECFLKEICRYTKKYIEIV